MRHQSMAHCNLTGCVASRFCRPSPNRVFTKQTYGHCFLYEFGRSTNCCSLTMATECEETEFNLISEMRATLAHTQKWLDNTVKKIGWSEDNLLHGDCETEKCPNDSSHFVHDESLPKHLKHCNLKRFGYSKSELEEESSAPSSKFCYERSNTVVSVDLDDATIMNIIGRASGGNFAKDRVLPQTMAHIQDLSREERLLLHKYVIDIATAARRPTTVPIEDLQMLEPEKTGGTIKSETLLDQRAQERDLKRRRQSYRGSKNVHTAKKSYPEVIHDVIESQCDILRQQWSKHSEENKSDKQKKSKRHKEYKADVE